jgi:pyridoxine 5-phosphate synthase
MPKLGVNIDHVATLRQARKEFDPDPVKAAALAEKCGADSIVCHLREDRRHINDRDVLRLRRSVRTKLNFEMSVDPSIVKVACRIRPDYAMLVPERRQEVTTEGGLDVVKHRRRIQVAVAKLKKKGITVSIFIDPAQKQINAAKALGASIVELHTGSYANATNGRQRLKELKKIAASAAYAKSLGLAVHAGHGLKYHNVRAIARIDAIDELNIGHAIVSRSVFTGLGKAVKDMKRLVRR